MSNFVRLDYLNTNNHESLPDLLIDDFDLLSIDSSKQISPTKSPDKPPKYHSIHHPKESTTKSLTKSPTKTSEKKRFLRLGKISLYNGVEERYFSDKQYMGILDTLNGRVVCVDLDTIYTECVQKNNNTLSIGNMLFNITPETKKIVCDYIFK